MPKFLSKLACILSLAIATCITPAKAQTGAESLLCPSTVFMPWTIDWLLTFPWTIAGKPFGDATKMNPAQLYMPPVCVCPSIFGVPLPGIGVTYWEPLYLAEIERHPGCLNTLGGVNIAPGFSMLGSHSNTGGDTQQDSNRMQVHWYEYPIFAMMDLFTSAWCKNPGGMNLGMVTEYLPNMQNDLWGAVFSPESVLFTDPVVQASCAIDAVASAAGMAIDAMPWCLGTWGGAYPFTASSSHANSDWSSNNQTLGKFLSFQSRIGLAWSTMGPQAMCSSVPMPIMIKNQYRYNQVFPVPLYGKAVTTGGTSLGVFPPVTNWPAFESSAHVIWQGKQCCLKMIP